MVPLFRPGVGEEEHDGLEPDPRGQNVEKFAQLGLEEVQPGQVPLLRLGQGPADAEANQVDAHAGFAGMVLREGGQPVPVPAARLEGDRPRARQRARARLAQRLLPPPLFFQLPRMRFANLHADGLSPGE